MAKKKLLAISGSTKSNSSNGAILRFIANSFCEILDIDLFESIDTIPHFNPDLDNETPPVSVKDLRNRIQLADAVLICTPEYVFSIPGSLKNIIEWNVSTTVFSNKPTSIIVAAASGEKAFEMLTLIMTAIEARIPEKAKMLVKGIKGKISTDGTITDAALFNNINLVVHALIKSIDEKDAVPTKYNT